jgi:hypothetical protein
MRFAPGLFGAAIVATLVTLETPRASAQQVLAQAFGSAALDDYGFSIAAGGPDLDGDGITEFGAGGWLHSGADYRDEVLLFSGDVSPTHYPTAKDSLVVSAAEGPTGNLVGLFLTDVNGTPTFALLALSTFDASGQARWSGYASTTITLRSFAIGRTHRLIDTSSETIAIQ